MDAAGRSLPFPSTMVTEGFTYTLSEVDFILACEKMAKDGADRV
jgi:hypothetical protein